MLSRFRTAYHATPVPLFTLATPPAVIVAGRSASYTICCPLDTVVKMEDECLHKDTKRAAAI
ncbi:MAG: hypothetical protein AAGN64_14810, partial [Bacteroidota bacterium]